jgi:tripartite-type tricarboxylate transporter receptor subunit TctC
LAVGAAALPANWRIAMAQSYPTRPITMIVSGAAGTNSDSIGRIIAERMREKLGRPIIIENIGGADGSIGAGRAARAKPDGYTIDIRFLGNHVLNGAFYSLNYHLRHRRFYNIAGPARSAALDPTQDVRSRKRLQIQLISVMTRKG